MTNSIPNALKLPSKFTRWRVGQEDSIDKIVFSPAKVSLLDSPTGSGKSLTAMAAYKRITSSDEVMDRLTDEEEIYRCIYITRTIQLQQQILSDFPAQMVKGRSNYPCSLRKNDFPKFTAADCPGQCNEPCPYKAAKLLAAKAPLAVLNDSYYLAETQSVRSLFSGANMVVIDEIDGLESSVLNAIQFSVSERQCKTYGLTPPLEIEDLNSWLTWVPRTLQRLTDTINIMKAQLPMNVGSWSPVDIENNREIKRAESFIEQMNIFYAESNDTWILDYEPKTRAGWRVTFKPVTVGPYCERYLWNNGKRFLGMSGTILDPQILADDLGIENYAYNRVDSQFPVENRLIHYKPICNLKYASMNEELPKLLAECGKIIKDNFGKNILIHTTSYVIRDYLMRSLPTLDINANILMTHDSENRADQLELFKVRRGAVMISPSFDRGVSLPDDECRIQIICKTPFLFLGDKQVKARLALPRGQQWYNLRAIQSVMQMTGRAVRSETDWAHCVAPNTRILTDDLRWVEASKLKVEDKLLAFDEKTSRTDWRRWRHAKVIATGIEELSRCKITFANGEELISTPDHRWICKNGKNKLDYWVRTDELKPGYKLNKYLNVWKELESYDIGWLAGLYDGEGCLTLSTGKRNPSVNSVILSQNNGSVLEKAKKILLNADFQIHCQQNPGLDCVHLNLNGGVAEKMRFLGQIRPIRKFEQIVPRFIASYQNEIVKIEKLNSGPMVTLQSSSGTYVAEGYAAHNTYILDKQFNGLLARTRHILPKWWLDSIIREAI